MLHAKFYFSSLQLLGIVFVRVFSCYRLLHVPLRNKY